ncbi:DivIVA domain-containing protein [Austwickia chelonae]|uniref:DivIVA domain-containing protein n=1 Tax=Austwickia chelonae TaxID=100225 RepID=UPI000E21C238|nr:DivIVA domain-containing protein [Austwickia chelonae]
MVLLSVLVVLLAGAVAALAAGRIGTGMSVAADGPVRASGHDPYEGVETLRSEDLDRLFLDRALRGYRMDQVDVVLDRLAVELADRDQLIDRLQARIEELEAAGSGGSDPLPSTTDSPA